MNLFQTILIDAQPVQALAKDADKEMAEIPWKDYTTMKRVLEDDNKKRALIKYVAGQTMTETRAGSDFMNLVFSDDFRNHVVQYK